MDQKEWEARYWDTAGRINTRPRYFNDRLALYIKQKAGPLKQMGAKAEEINAILSPVVNNWESVKDFVPDDGCMLPLVAKYASFAHLEHASDAIVDDIYDEAVRVAKISEAKYPQWCGNPPEEYTMWPLHPRGGYISPRAEKAPSTKSAIPHQKAAFDLCEIARHPAKERLEKVLAVETVISARHNAGPFFQHLCLSTTAAAALVDTVLDILAGN